MADSRPVTQADVQKLYQESPSFTDFLPWVEYLPEQQSFLLEDGLSQGAAFELVLYSSDVCSETSLVELRDALQIVFTDAIPEQEPGPWVVQFFLQDEPDLGGLIRTLSHYPAADVQNTRLFRQHVARMRDHLARLSAPGGAFVDQQVTGTAWRARLRRVRCTLYRRQADATISPLAVAAELDEVAARWSAAMAAAGIQCTRLGGREFYEWLLPWFNPPNANGMFGMKSALEFAPYPGDEHLPFGSAFAEQLVLTEPSSVSGLWWFNQAPQRVITHQSLRTAPAIGHFTAERLHGEHSFALFDRLPENTCISLTVTVRAQHVLRNQVETVRRASVGDQAEAALTREEACQAQQSMANGDKVFPVDLAYYLRGDDPVELARRCNALNAGLLPNGLHAIEPQCDLLAQDSYLRYLPMAYDPAFDRRRRRSRLMFSQHIANLSPVMGRSRGSGHPGLFFFNRGAEPLAFDPLNPADRRKNAHLLILGPTGAGKSALLVYLLEQMLAIHRPRLFIIEAGNSFGLLAEHWRRLDVSVNQLSLKPGSAVSLPPFSGALEVLRAHQETAADLDEASDDKAERDVLGELEIVARIMVTGGDAREDARLTRADRALLRKAIVDAARKVEVAGRDHVLTEDVVQALKAASLHGELPESRRLRARDMSDAMSLFCGGFAGSLFNRPGDAWPEADVTLVDLAVLAREGYEDQLTVAYLSLMNHINALVEQHQHDSRPTLVVTDEGHIITTNPLLSRYVVKVTKMWRKLGAWFWIATQNLEDFPDASRRMLNMMEWWLCLVMPKEEVDQIARFKDLSPEQQRLLLATRKQPGCYTEGVVLADGLNALFRAALPPEILALAMTEKQEKAERAALMAAEGIDELDAAYRIAERLTRPQTTD